jgi:hypothetical protein
MRAPLLIAAALCLAACGNNDQTDNTPHVVENLSAENIVSNDVTGIDAVTGDASNMAADVQFNAIDNSLDNGTEAADSTNSSNPAKPSKPAAKKPAPDKASATATTNAAANTTD